MKISSKVKLSIRGITIRPGVGNYPLDHKDPLTAHELYILKFEQRVIDFNEILSMEKGIAESRKKTAALSAKNTKQRAMRIKKAKNVRESNEGIGRPGRDGDSDSGGGDLPNEGENASSVSGALPERRDGDNQTS